MSRLLDEIRDDLSHGPTPGVVSATYFGDGQIPGIRFGLADGVTLRVVENFNGRRIRLRRIEPRQTIGIDVMLFDGIPAEVIADTIRAYLGHLAPKVVAP